MRDVYDPVHPEIWSGSLATFAVTGEGVGIAVTPTGSEHDRRVSEAWRRLRSDHGALEAYNRMKLDLRTAATPITWPSKADFFNRLAER